MKRHPKSSIQAVSRRYRMAFGVTPHAIQLLVAIMAHMRVTGRGVTRRQVALMLDVTDVNAGPLIRLGWIVGDATHSPNQILTVTDKGWRNVWPWRFGWPEKDRRTA
jgi:hypothetical protein